MKIVDAPPGPGVGYRDVADFVYILLTLAFFALAAVLVGFIDRRMSR